MSFQMMKKIMERYNFNQIQESYDDNDDDQCGKNYSEGGEY